MRLLLNLYVWIAWTAAVVAWTPLVFATWALTAWWDPQRRIAGRLFRRCAAAATRITPFWNLEIRGELPERTDHPFVAVSNHESLADVVIIGSLPWEMKWLSKASNFRMPFVGWMMRLVGDVRVRRRDPESRNEAYGELRRWLQRGVSVMIFPEGTRSPTPELLPFRNGAFRLAIDVGVPVQPIAVTGTRDSVRKGSIWFAEADIVIRILEPIRTAGLTEADAEELRDRVQEQIDRARREGSRRSGTGHTGGRPAAS